MDQLQKINEKKILKLTQQLARMKLLATKKGFVQEYYKSCKTAKTNNDAFEAINNEYFDLFGEFRYRNFESFRKIKNRFIK